MKFTRSIDHFRQHAWADKKTCAGTDGIVRLLSVQNCPGADEQIALVTLGKFRDCIRRAGETVSNFDRAKSASDYRPRRGERMFN